LLVFERASSGILWKGKRQNSDYEKQMEDWIKNQQKSLTLISQKLPLTSCLLPL